MTQPDGFGRLSESKQCQFGIGRRNLMRRLLLGLAVVATTLVPGVASADDTQIADFIQTRLQAEQQQGRLRGFNVCLLYTSPSPRDQRGSRMPSSA